MAARSSFFSALPSERYAPSERRQLTVRARRIIRQPSWPREDMETAAMLDVLGHRGKNAFLRWLMGSVSQRVIAYANCSVTGVK